MKDFLPDEADKEIIGRIAVKAECANAPMEYVFIHGISENFSEEDKPMYQCRVLNTGGIVFAYPENLIFDADWNAVEKSRMRFNLKKAESTVSFLARELKGMI